MASDPEWHLYRSFLAVMREGTLSAAARRLRLTQPTLGRHIEELERALSTALFTRSPGGLTPTPSAQAALPLAEAMEASALAIARATQSRPETVEGTVRITASEVVGAGILPPLLSPIRARHPGLVLELALNNRAEDLLRRDADVAVRMARPQQRALLARKLGTVGLGLYAHTDYLAANGKPSSLEDLRRFHLIGFDRDDHSARSVVTGDLPIDRSIFAFRSDSDLAQAAALQAGLGIGVMQHKLARRNVALVRVLPAKVEFRLDAWIVMHEGQRGNRAVKHVFEELGKGFQAWLEDPGR